MALSGRQITAIAIAACAAVVLAPVSVTAATSGVSIFDPTSTGAGSKARVSSGMLAVNDDPSTAFSRYGSLSDNGTSALIVSIPANKKLTLGTLTFSHSSGPGGIDVVVQQLDPVGATCTGSMMNMGYPFSANLSAGETTSVNYAPRLAIASRSYLTCLKVYIPSSANLNYVDASITGTIS